MFENLKQDALKANVPIIKDQVVDILIKELNSLKPKNIVEIGSAIWYSSLIIANTIQPWNWKLTTFEISYLSYFQALENFQKYKQYNITAYNLDPLLVNLKKVFCNEKIDFLFIDAVMKFYLDFLLLFEDLIENNCSILLDNVVKFKSKTKSLYRFLEQNQINYEIFSIAWNDGIMRIYVKDFLDKIKK